MTHPDIAMAVANAHRDDLLRAAESWRRGHAVTRVDRSGRDRVAAWLKAQLRRRPTAVRPAPAPRSVAPGSAAPACVGAHSGGALR